MSFEAEKADIKTELHFSKLAMLCRFKSSMVRVKWAMLCRRFPVSKKCTAGQTFDYMNSHCQNAEVLPGTLAAASEHRIDDNSKTTEVADAKAYKLDVAQVEKEFNQETETGQEEEVWGRKPQRSGVGKPVLKTRIKKAMIKEDDVKKGFEKAVTTNRKKEEAETQTSSKKLPQPVLCELLSALQGLEQFYFDLYLAFSGQSEDLQKSSAIRTGHSAHSDTLEGRSASLLSRSGPRFLLRSRSVTSLQSSGEVLAGNSLAFGGHPALEQSISTLQLDTERKTPPALREGVSTKLLRIVQQMSSSLLAAVENEMFAMYLLLTIANEDAAKKATVEQQNAVVISLAKWYKEANLTDVLHLLAKTIEYAVTGEYIRNPVLLELPFDHCTSQVQIRDVQIPHQLLYRVQFAGKTGEDACIAFKHILAFHMSLSTSALMIKGTIDAKLLQCDCQSMGSYCRCSPREFAPAREPVLGGMEDTLEGNCMSSCC